MKYEILLFDLDGTWGQKRIKIANTAQKWEVFAYVIQKYGIKDITYIAATLQDLAALLLP